ncbi:MAG: hypothetical protein HQL95_07415 [Magnetococcales bacterium]|nr:hypothetical protein [Magnetococcales bacterium]
MTFESVRLRVGLEGREFSLSDHPVLRAAVAGKSRLVESREQAYDTEDGRLRRKGVLLVATRHGAKWTGCATWSREGSPVSREWECGSGEAPEWSDLKKQLPEPLLDGVRGRNLECRFALDLREERWRLEYPDGARITVRQFQGGLSGGETEEGFHEVLLERSGGDPIRFLQTVLAVARHCGAFLEPLSPAERVWLRLDPGVLQPGPMVPGEASAGERIGLVLCRTGGAHLEWLRGQLPVLLYGAGDGRRQAVLNGLEAVRGLQRLVAWFGEWLPETMRRDMENELLWLSGEFSPACAGAGLARERLARMRVRFPDQPRLAELSARAEQELESALDQAVAVVRSLRFTRLYIGFAIWLASEEGLKSVAVEVDPALRERLAMPAEGMARELLRRLHKPLSEMGGKGGEESLDLASVAGIGAQAAALAQGLALFAGWVAERRLLEYRQRVDALVVACEGWLEMDAQGRLGARLLSEWPEEAVVPLWAGWSGALLEVAGEGFRRALEAFQRAASLTGDFGK